MKIARLLIYEGTREALAKHFGRPGLFIPPGTSRDVDVKISEDLATGPGGRVELQDGEIAVIKVVR